MARTRPQSPPPPPGPPKPPDLRGPADPEREARRAALEAELAAIAARERAARDEAIAARRATLAGHIDFLLSLTEHTPPCYEGDTDGWWDNRNHCPRCMLLHAQANGHADAELERLRVTLP
jgi:hypothetical protein